VGLYLVHRPIRNLEGWNGISRSIYLLEHDLFGKPVSTFPDHALERGTVSAQEPGIKAMSAAD
jgi:hypothetical protein